MLKKTELVGIALSLFLISPQTFALVEYDDEYEDDSVSSRMSAPKRAPQKKKNPVKVFKNFNKADAPKGKSSFSLFKMVQLSTSFQSVDLSLNSPTSSTETFGKIDKLNLGLMVHTPYDLYLDISYWEAKSSFDIVDNSLKNTGNARYVLGFNWFKGQGSRADIYVGRVQGAEESQFASSRSDNVIGLETTKQIESVVLGFGAEYRITGKPSEESEYAVGNITQLSAGIGWIVSNDIRFTFEAYAYKVAQNNDDGITNKLGKEYTFSTFEPKLHLQLFPAVEMELAGSFRTNKPDLKNDTEIQEFIGAKLLDLKGSYGNSIYAGLNFSI
jgi:hypothetical protein